MLHVPDFQFKLLSVSKLCDQIVGKVIFTSTDCTLQGLTSQEVVLGKASNRLYQVQHADPRLDTTVEGSLRMGNDYQAFRCSNLCFSEVDSWHYRLGHLSFNKLK